MKEQARQATHNCQPTPTRKRTGRPRSQRYRHDPAQVHQDLNKLKPESRRPRERNRQERPAWRKTAPERCGGDTIRWSGPWQDPNKLHPTTMCARSPSQRRLKTDTNDAKRYGNRKRNRLHDTAIQQIERSAGSARNYAHTAAFTTPTAPIHAQRRVYERINRRVHAGTSGNGSHHQNAPTDTRRIKNRQSNQSVQYDVKLHLKMRHHANGTASMPRCIATGRLIHERQGPCTPPCIRTR